MKGVTFAILAIVLSSVLIACGSGTQPEATSVFTRTFTADDLPMFVIQPSDTSVPLYSSASDLNEMWFFWTELMGEPQDPTPLWKCDPQAGELRDYHREADRLWFHSYAILLKDPEGAKQFFKVLSKKFGGGDYKRIESVGLGDESIEFALPQQQNTNWTYYTYLWRASNVVLLIQSQDASGQSLLKEEDVFSLALQIQSRMK